MRIIFMGSPAFAVPTLATLVAAGHDIVAVYAQPPRPAARGKKPQRTSVHAWAEDNALAVLTPASLKGAAEQAEFAAHDADVAVVAAYGLILPQAILDAPRHGCFNVHASLLPRWRGAAPIHRAILAGDAETGVSIMQMEAGLDTGPVRMIERTSIASKTTGVLTTELAALGAQMMLRALQIIDAFPAVAQVAEGVTYAPKVAKDEARIDWLLSAVQIERATRAFNPAPGAWFELGGERVKLLSADVMPPAESAHGAAPGTVLDDALTIACNPGAIRPVTVQRAGKGAMPVAEMLRGWPVTVGTKLS